MLENFYTEEKSKYSKNHPNWHIEDSKWKAEQILHSIAKEKGGIIKEGIPLVIGRANEEIERLFLSMAHKKQSAITLAYNAYKPSFHTLSREGSTISRIRKLNGGSVNRVICESGDRWI